MTPNEWLNHLASILAPRLPRCRAHLAAYAPSFAKDIPSRWLTAAMAEAVEGSFRSLPTYAELRQALQRQAELLPPATSAAPQDKSEYDLKADMWFDFAARRLAEAGDARLPYLLSLLKQQSEAAWWRFAEAYAPDVFQVERARKQEMRDRAEGLLPTPRMPRTNLRHIEGPQGRNPVKRKEEAAPVRKAAYLTPEQERAAWGALPGASIAALPETARAGLRALEVREAQQAGKAQA